MLSGKIGCNKNWKIVVWCNGCDRDSSIPVAEQLTLDEAKELYKKIRDEITQDKKIFEIETDGEKRFFIIANITHVVMREKY